MPSVNMELLEESRRHQVVQEYEVYPLNTSDIKDYQIKLAGISSSIEEDARIIQDELIDQWAESKGNIWSKLANLKAKTPQNILVLSGNPSSPDINDGHATFVDFDDFDEDGEKTDFANITYIGGYEANPVIPCGAIGEYDEKIIEIGNVLYDPSDTPKYRTFYGVFEGAYAQAKAKTAYASSNNGIDWTKHGIVINDFLEDPYVVKSGSTWYLYAEDKQSGSSHDIRLYTSTNCTNWTDRGIVIARVAATWEAYLTASPVVWIEGSTWHMLYEGNPAGSGSQTGYATSSDGISWNKYASNPVINDGKDLVSCDIIKIGSIYYLFGHYRIYTSTNLTSWAEHPNNPIQSGGWIHMQPYWDGTEYVFHHYDLTGGSGGGGIKGIYRDYPMKSASLAERGWTIQANTWTIDSNVLKGSGANATINRSIESDTQIYRIKIKASSTSNDLYVDMFGDITNKWGAFKLDGGTFYYINNAGWQTTGKTYSIDTWYTLIITYHKDTKIYDYEISEHSWSISGITPYALAGTNIFRMYHGGAYPDNSFYDTYYVRKYTANEPIISQISKLNCASLIKNLGSRL